MTASSSPAPPPEVGAAGLESGKTLHFPCLDAFRFFAMMMVLVAHVTFATRPWVEAHVPNWGQAVLGRANLGVPIFFLLSGFLLFRPFIGRQLENRPPMRTRTYLRRRALRIFPGYWFALTACVLFLGQLLGSARNAFLYYSLLFPFASPDVALGGGAGHEGDYGIPQAWSLSVEIVLYLMLPLVALYLVRRGAGKPHGTQIRYALAATIVLFVVGQAFRLYFLTAHPSWEKVGAIMAPDWVDFFAIGMGLAVFSAWAEHGNPLPRVLQYLGDHPWVSWAIAAVFGFVCLTFRAPDLPYRYGAEYWFRSLLFAVVAFFLLVPAMFGDQTAGRARKVLASRPLVYLGTVSLGFYLFHLAILTNVQEWLAPAGVSGAFYGSLPTVLVLTFVLSVAAASISYWCVERPFLVLKDRPLRSVLHRRSGAAKAQAAKPVEAS
ncbi:MAG TPA: acyltransferase [Acidimicrobiia bacterium]